MLKSDAEYELKQALVNASITDFAIFEYRDTLGGRVWHTDFGADENGKPYVVEFGANWVRIFLDGKD